MTKEKKGFSFDFKKDKVRVMDPDETDALKQLMKTNLMHPINPEMNYILPGRILIKLLNQISKQKNQLEKYEEKESEST